MKKSHDADNTEKRNDIPNPHDAAFKSAFQRKELAQDFFRNYLPEDVARHADFGHLELVNKSYVDEKFEERHSDLVYKTKIRGKPAFLYLLFEHQSKSDPMMAFRLLCYMVNIWKAYLDQNPKRRKLPVIIPLVLYHGKGRWTSPRKFARLVRDGERFSAYLPDFVYELTNLGEYDDDTLMGEIALRFVLHTFKHIYDGDMGRAFRLARDFLAELQESPTFLALLEWFLRYLYHTRTEDEEELGKMIASLSERLADKEVREMAMTVAEKIEQRGRKIGREEGWKEGREEGREEGKQEGKEESRKETAANLLRLGVDVRTISQATGLSEKEIRQLLTQ